jgi:hypothetical protein
MNWFWKNPQQVVRKHAECFFVSARYSNANYQHSLDRKSIDIDLAPVTFVMIFSRSIVVRLPTVVSFKRTNAYPLVHPV